LGPTSFRRSGMHKANLQKSFGLSIPSGRAVFIGCFAKPNLLVVR
jgi:hypothetical protein